MKSITKPENLTSNQPPIQVIQKGWEALNRSIGPTDALRFVMSLTIGQGNSVKFFKQIWGKKTIQELHNEILKAKKTQKI